MRGESAERDLDDLRWGRARELSFTRTTVVLYSNGTVLASGLFRSWSHARLISRIAHRNGVAADGGVSARYAHDRQPEPPLEPRTALVPAMKPPCSRVYACGMHEAVYACGMHAGPRALERSCALGPTDACAQPLCTPTNTAHAHRHTQHRTPHRGPHISPRVVATDWLR